MIREIACLGDSITLGRAQVPRGYPDQLKILEPAWGVANFGEGGDYVEDMAVRYSAVIANRGFTDVVFLGGTNNASRGDNVSTVIATATALWDLILANGERLWICEITPRAGWVGHTPQIQTFVDTFNAGISTYVAAHPEAKKISLYGPMEDGSTPDALAAGMNVGSDGLHPDQTGLDFIAGEVFDAMSQI
jgi:lysophospholipase L1-like esterase